MRSPLGGLAKDKMKMKTYLLSFVLLTLLAVPSISQRITIYPLLDSLNSVGTCTPPQMICELKESSLGIDTIVIRVLYGDRLCTGFPLVQANIIPALYYIIRDSLNQFRYKLWLRPTSYNTSQRLGFDTAYAPSPQLYIMDLNVLVGSNLVDSANIKFRIITTGLYVDDIHNSIPSQVILEQNYPNPFNPSTFISFTIPSKEYVSLKVSDLRGNEVTSLISGLLSAGDHSFQWNAKGLSSGIYFYRIQAGSFFQTKKLCLIK